MTKQHKNRDEIESTSAFSPPGVTVFFVMRNEPVAQVAHFKGHLKK